jgi:hypothetical protein
MQAFAPAEEVNMYFVELENGENLNLFGMRKWKGNEVSLFLDYGNGYQVLHGEDAARVLKCLQGFRVRISDIDG